MPWTCPEWYGQASTPLCGTGQALPCIRRLPALTGPQGRVGRVHHRPAGPGRPVRMRISVREKGRTWALNLRSTDTGKDQLADLELRQRQRQRARCENRICSAKDTGPQNLTLEGFAQNHAWRKILALACELSRTQIIAWRAPPAAGTRTPAAPSGRALAIGRRDHRRNQPVCNLCLRLTNRNSLKDQEGDSARARETPLTQRGSQALPVSGIRIRPAGYGRERSRLISMGITRVLRMKLYRAPCFVGDARVSGILVLLQGALLPPSEYYSLYPTSPGEGAT